MIHYEKSTIKQFVWMKYMKYIQILIKYITIKFVQKSPHFPRQPFENGHFYF